MPMSGKRPLEEIALSGYKSFRELKPLRLNPALSANMLETRTPL